MSILKEALEILNKKEFPEENEYVLIYFIADVGRAVFNDRRTS